MRVNPVKHTLRQGGVSFGTMVFEFMSPGLPRVLAEAGAEFVVFDTEHTWLSSEQIGYLIASSRATGMVPLVRVANLDYPLLSRPLDMGAQGLMIPRVETRAQVEAVIKAMKYPPAGERGVGLTLAHDDYTGGDVHAKLRQANNETLVIVQVETAAAIENLEEMLSVPGVDVAWVGHFDLSVSMGIPGDFDHPRFLAAIDRMVEVCRRHKIAPGVMQGSVGAVSEWMERGFRAIAYSGDVWLLQNALRDGLTQLKQGRGRPR
jgi:2-dehydro-3-deoxyglucarate aldolase/4-hydroxy-2-oxoheptanedioate aldolase